MPSSTPATAARVAPSTKVMEMTTWVSIPNRLAILMSSEQARQARPMRERPMNWVSASMVMKVTTKMMSCIQERLAWKPSASPRVQPPEIRVGMAMSREPWAIRIMFCRKIDMPMAEMRGISRLPPRSGR